MTSKIETLLKVIADLNHFEKNSANSSIKNHHNTADLLTDAELEMVSAASHTPRSEKNTTAE